MARERIDYIDGPCLASAIRSGAEWVASKRVHLNEINVFPVPDGDTGTNLTLTLKAAADAKLPFALHLLFGGPTETIADVATSRKFLDSCSTPNAVFASIGIRIYSFTTLERIARDEGVISSRADLFEPTYYVSKELGDDPVGAVDVIARSPDKSGRRSNLNCSKRRDCRGRLRLPRNDNSQN